MRNNFKLLGLIAIMMIAAFSFVSCELEEAKGCGCCENCSDTCDGTCCGTCTKGGNNNSITITVTGNFSQFNGWKASVQLGPTDKNDKTVSAYAGYQNVTSSTTSFTFSLYTNNTLTTPFETAGNYFIYFWFEKDSKEDVGYYIENHALVKGSNTIALTSFTSLTESEQLNLPAELIGEWTKEGDTTHRLKISNSIFQVGLYYSGGASGYDDYEIISYESTTITLGYDGVPEKTFQAYVSGGKLIISGITGEMSDYNGTYTSGGIEWPSNTVWAEYGLPGLKQPAGSSVFNVETYFGYVPYGGYQDELFVHLEADQNAFEDLKDQLDILDIYYDDDDVEYGADYSYLQTYYNDSKNNLSIKYESGELTIHIVKPAVLFSTGWGKGSGANFKGVVFNSYEGEVYFYDYDASGNPKDAIIFEFSDYSNGNIEAYYNFGGEAGYIEVNFSVIVTGSTLTISDLPDEGALDLSRFNGTYTKAGG